MEKCIECGEGRHEGACFAKGSPVACEMVTEILIDLNEFGDVVVTQRDVDVLSQRWNAESSRPVIFGDSRLAPPAPLSARVRFALAAPFLRVGNRLHRRAEAIVFDLLLEQKSPQPSGSR